MRTLYRKVAVSERMPPPMTDILIKYRWNGYFEPYHYFDDLHCKDEMLNEVTHWIEEIPDPTAQLQEEIETLVECDIPTVMSNYGKADGTRESSINYNEGHQTSWKKGFKKALEITNPSITQLQADKAELLEALENIVDYGGVANFDTLNSLIQKHKK